METQGKHTHSFHFFRSHKNIKRVSQSLFQCEEAKTYELFQWNMFSCTHRSRPVDSDGNITRCSGCSGTGLAFGVFFISGAGLLPRAGRLRDPMTANFGSSVSPS
jgi:hypothetical protein